MRRPASLRRRADFARLRRYGRRIATENLNLYIADSRGGDASSLVGITVRKSIGKAVVRNTLRRRLSAILQELLPSQDRMMRVLVVPRPDAAALAFADLRAEVRSAFGTWQP
jgi:ribonuclease P protein component